MEIVRDQTALTKFKAWVLSDVDETSGKHSSSLSAAVKVGTKHGALKVYKTPVALGTPIQYLYRLETAGVDWTQLKKKNVDTLSTYVLRGEEKFQTTLVDGKEYLASWKGVYTFLGMVFSEHPTSKVSLLIVGNLAYISIQTCT
jgi:hypothetical protein